jgi:DeoR family suf operon transcriptional repressor
MDDTKRRILELLRVRGGQTVAELAQALGVTRTAVVGHLAALRADGFVASGGLRAGSRRPSRLYVAAPGADAWFPKAYQEFADALLDALSDEGDGTLERALGRLGQRWVTEDLPRVAQLHGHARLRMVQQILAKRGFLPTVESTGRGYTLREHNCPVMRLASKHPEICAVIHRWLEQLAGAPLTRTRCMSQGDGFSEYVAGP